MCNRCASRKDECVYKLYVSPLSSWLDGTDTLQQPDPILYPETGKSHQGAGRPSRVILKIANFNTPVFIPFESPLFQLT